MGTRMSVNRGVVAALCLVLLVVSAGCSSKKTIIQGAGGGELPNNGFPQAAGAEPAPITFEEFMKQLEAEIEALGQLKLDQNASGITPASGVFPPSGESKDEAGALKAAGVTDVWVGIFTGPKLSYASASIGQAKDDAAAAKAAGDLYGSLFKGAEPKPDSFSSTIDGTKVQGFVQETYPAGTSSVMAFGADGPYVLWVRLDGDDKEADQAAAEAAFAALLDKIPTP